MSRMLQNSRISCAPLLETSMTAAKHLWPFPLNALKLHNLLQAPVGNTNMTAAKHQWCLVAVIPVFKRNHWRFYHLKIFKANDHMCLAAVRLVCKRGHRRFPPKRLALMRCSRYCSSSLNLTSFVVWSNHGAAVEWCANQP